MRAPAGALMSQLSEKSFWALLDRARQVRNQRAHGGIVSTDQVDRWLVSLETLRGETEQALADTLDEIDLVLAVESSYQNGIYSSASTHERQLLALQGFSGGQLKLVKD
jgi:hypothetical protein